MNIPNNAGNGTDYVLNGNVLQVNNGFSGSITAMYEFTNSNVRDIDFEYNHNGLRTRKTVMENGVTTTYDYTLHGKLITHLTKRTVGGSGNTTQEMHFFYDAQGRPAFVEYEGTMYRYVHNLQGDVVGILDTGGDLVVEYKYDAWGKPLSIDSSLKTSLGELNPFRYRGYEWDAEVELYYLRSRYYLANTCRFINMDASIPALKRSLSQNVFGYCRNNAINYFDQSGCSEQSFNIPEETIFIDSTLSNVNVLLLVYVPDKEDIDNKVIGHFELALEYNNQWLVYSYGIGKADKNDPEVYSALLKVREKADWGQDSGINYTRYAFGFNASEEQIRNGIGMMGIHTGKGEFAIPKVGKYPLSSKSGFATYSLNKAKGNVCRGYVVEILSAIGIYFMENALFKTNEAYYPTGFMNIVKRQMGIKN